MRGARRICGAGVACVAAATAIGCGNSVPPEEITVRRINVVDESGEIRLVIAGELPGPIVRGQALERAIVPAGIIWYDRNGDESGGLAAAPVSGWKGAPEVVHRVPER